MNHNDLSLYKTFYIVAKNGSISKATNELYISQPAVSKSIKKLENNLNVELFTRTSKGVTLTSEGKILYKHTERAFEELYSGEKIIEHMSELDIGHITIGVSTTLCKYVLLPYLNKFIHNNPHTNVTIECQSSYQTLKLIKEHKIDIGLVNEPNSFSNLDFFKVGEIQDIFVATKSYLEHLKIREDFTNCEAIDPANIFRTCNLMLLDEKNLTRKHINEYLIVNKVDTNQILEVTSMDLLIEFAKTSLGVACVIEEFVEPELNNGSLLKIPISVPIAKRNIGFIHDASTPQNTSTNKFVHFYKNNIF